jgi:peptidoglycan/xylan/chitin deacetylase (PgdA/CDA1 family)
MYRIRAILKRCIAYALYWSGMLWIYRRILLRNRAVVLTYHRVLPCDADSFSAPGIVVSPRVFAANMAFLRKHFHPLSAGQFRSCLHQRKFPTGACLVTFDDGWHDNETHALPVLRRLGVPAVLFVATGFIGTRSTFWQERMTRQLVALSHVPDAGRSTLAELGLAETCDASETERRLAMRGFVDQLKSMTTDQIENAATLVSTACSDAGISEAELGDDYFLDWSALKSMTGTGTFAIGSHGHSHVPLPRLGRDAAMADLQRSVREFESHGIPPPSLFAYPNGDYDATSMDCLKDVGLYVGFTTEPGYVDPSSDPRRLPRVNVHTNSASTPAEFLCRILGIF